MRGRPSPVSPGHLGPAGREGVHHAGPGRGEAWTVSGRLPSWAPSLQNRGLSGHAGSGWGPSAIHLRIQPQMRGLRDNGRPGMQRSSSIPSWRCLGEKGCGLGDARASASGWGGRRMACECVHVCECPSRRQELRPVRFWVCFSGLHVNYLRNHLLKYIE